MGEERVSRKQFIRLGGALGVGVAGSSVLVACGGGESGASGQSTSGSGGGESTASAGGTTQASSQPSTTSPTVEQGGVIVQEEFLPPNQAFAFNVAGDDGASQPAVLVHMEDGSWMAYSAVCTHAGCEVAYQLNSQTLGCPCHGSMFDPADGGSVVQGPAEQPLQEIQVEASGGNVMLA